MSNRIVHTTTGVASSLVANINSLANDFNNNDKAFVRNLITCIGASYVGSRIPDILEPAIDPNHRSTFHSLIGGVAIYKFINFLLKMVDNSNLSFELKNQLKQFLINFRIGYFSHLLLDALTPKGIPFLK